MPAPLLLGIDLGTTRVKAAIFDTHGRQVAAASRPNRLRVLGPGRVEQSLEEVSEAADAAVRAVVAALGERTSQVAAIGVTGQMGGITALDRAGRPTIPYDSPLDLRSAAAFERWMLPIMPLLLRRTGAAPEWGQKPLYWRDERPEVWERIVRFTTLAGAYVAELVGLAPEEAFVDHTYASHSGFWSGGATWDRELLALVGLNAEKLPRLARPTDVVGRLRPARAAALGLRAELPVIAGAGDGMASVLGAGGVDPGLLVDLSGTATALIGCVDRFVVDVEGQWFNCKPSALPGVWHPSYVLFGGQAVRWFAEQFPPAGEAGADLATRLRHWDARAAPEDQEQPETVELFFLPHLGGRWYPPRPAARGGWLGLTWGARPEHLYLAILKSVAFEFALALERMRALIPGWQPGEVRVLGGGARSTIWNQLKADILGLPHVPLKELEFAARGVALLAGAAVGVISDLPDVARRAEPEAVVSPRSGRLAQRAQERAAYRRLVEETERLFSSLAAPGSGAGQSAGRPEAAGVSQPEP